MRPPRTRPPSIPPSPVLQPERGVGCWKDDMSDDVQPGAEPFGQAGDLFDRAIKTEHLVAGRVQHGREDAAARAHVEHVSVRLESDEVHVDAEIRVAVLPEDAVVLSAVEHQPARGNHWFPNPKDCIFGISKRPCRPAAKSRERDTRTH